MGRRTWWAVAFVTTHIIFIFVYVRRQAYLVTHSFERQHMMQLCTQLRAQRDALKAKLISLQRHERIQEFAQTQLQLKPMQTRQIQRLTHDGIA